MLETLAASLLIALTFSWVVGAMIFTSVVGAIGCFFRLWGRRIDDALWRLTVGLFVIAVVLLLATAKPLVLVGAAILGATVLALRALDRRLR